MSAADARLVCPACPGPKTARARLCRNCRARAIELGISAVIRARTLRGAPSTQESITAGMISAVHGMAAKIDKIHGLPRRTTHDRALEQATQIFGRDISSVLDLDRLESNLIADWLNAQLTALDRATGRAGA